MPTHSSESMMENVTKMFPESPGAKIKTAANHQHATDLWLGIYLPKELLVPFELPRFYSTEHESTRVAKRPPQNASLSRESSCKTPTRAEVSLLEAVSRSPRADPIHGRFLSRASSPRSAHR